MKIEKDLNAINKNEFTAIFGSVFEKSEWIATETFKHKPFKNYQDLIDKMIKIYESCSIDQIINILNLHPKLAIEKPWQGKPPNKTSKSFGISELGIFVISPRTI